MLHTMADGKQGEKVCANDTKNEVLYGLQPNVWTLAASETNGRTEEMNLFFAFVSSGLGDLLPFPLILRTNIV